MDRTRLLAPSLVTPRLWKDYSFAFPGEGGNPFPSPAHGFHFSEGRNAFFTVTHPRESITIHLYWRFNGPPARLTRGMMLASWFEEIAGTVRPEVFEVIDIWKAFADNPDRMNHLSVMTVPVEGGGALAFFDWDWLPQKTEAERLAAADEILEIAATLPLAVCRKLFKAREIPEAVISHL